MTMNKEDIKRSMTKQSKTKTPATMASLNSEQIGSTLMRYKGLISQIAPKHLNAERLIQLCALVIRKNPNIAACSTTSIIGAVTQASILGFQPTEVLSHFYFVPYNIKLASGGWSKECQFQVSYKGWIDLARRSGEIQTIHSYCVFEGDDFDYQLGLNPDLNHRPASMVDRTDAKKLLYSYAVVKYHSGGFNFVVLTKKEIESYRLRSPMARKNPEPTGPWKTDYPKMAMAKAVKQLVAFLPTTVELVQAANSDEGIIKADLWDQSTGTPSVEFPEAEIDEDIPERPGPEPEAKKEVEVENNKL